MMELQAQLQVVPVPGPDVVEICWWRCKGMDLSEQHSLADPKFYDGRIVGIDDEDEPLLTTIEEYDSLLPDDLASEK